MKLRTHLRRFSLLVAFCGGVTAFCQVSRAVAEGSPWIEGGSYRFRNDSVRSCGTAPPLANRSTDSRDAAPLLGFLVRIEAQSPDFVVSPRDLTLESDGVVLEPMLLHPGGRWRCSPLLSFQRLAAGRAARGYVFFRVPGGFRASKGPIVLAYKPTRWGGARKLVAQLQKCLELCKPPSRDDGGPGK